MNYITTFNIKDISAAFKCADSFIKMTTKHTFEHEIYLGFEDKNTAVMLIASDEAMIKYKIENNYFCDNIIENFGLPKICIEGSTDKKYGILLPNDVIKQLYDFFNFYKDKGCIVELYLNNISDTKYEVEFVYNSRKSGFTYDNNKPMRNYWDIITKFDNLPKSYNFTLPAFISRDYINMINKFFGNISHIQIDAIENKPIFKFTYREKNDVGMEQQIEFYFTGLIIQNTE